jgi:hypothetical protein
VAQRTRQANMQCRERGHDFPAVPGKVEGTDEAFVCRRCLVVKVLSYGVKGVTTTFSYPGEVHSG